MFFRNTIVPVQYTGPKLASRIVHSNKKVIYTIILGDYDSLREPEIISKGWDYVCFTDRDDLHSEHWKIIRVKCPSGMNRKRCSAYFITYPFRYLKHYEISILIAGRMSIRCNLNDLLREHLPPGRSIALPKHPRRTCIYDEAERVIEVKKDSAEVVDRQMRKYRSQGFPAHFGLIRTGLVIRRHDDSRLRKHCRLWLKEISLHSQRDQLSFNYVLWKYKLVDPHYIPPGVIGKEFRLNYHNFEQIFT